MLSAEQRRELIEMIRLAPEQLAERVRGLSVAQLTTHFLPGEWTVAQNVHHLAQGHLHSFLRMKMILIEENPPIRPFDQDAWARTPEAQSADIGDSLQLLTGLHAHWAAFCESLSDADWQRTAVHGELGPVTMESLFKYYAKHTAVHIGQITRTLAAQ